MTKNEGAQTAFAGVQRGHLQKVAKLVDHDALIHRIDPRKNAVEEFSVGLRGKIAALRSKRNFEFQLFGESQIDGKERTKLLPLLLAPDLAFHQARNLQSCQRIIHGLFTQEQFPSANSTATALRPS